MSSMNASNFKLSVAVRRAPFFEATVRHGASEFSAYNHMHFRGQFSFRGIEELLFEWE